jgi:hypothetical protein
VAGEVENALRAAAAKVAAYVEDAGTMTVITQYVGVGPTGDVDFATAKPVARTTVRLDGDSEAIVPVRQAEGSGGRLEVDATLLDLHERNVTAATEYRARILQALMSALPGRGR